MESLQAKLPRSEILAGEIERITQRELNKEINIFTMDQWKSASEPAERVHLQAYSALGCGYEVDCVPSKTLDMNFSYGDFVMTMSRRLGVDVMEGNVPCGFCGQLLDAGGLHACSCTAGGDATAQHNAVRDVYYDYCERSGLQPE